MLLGLIILCLSACQLSPFPTGSLQGEVKEAASFDFAAEFQLLQLETGGVYSVFLRVVIIDHELYIDAAQNRRWHRNLKQDPNVRVKLGRFVYPAKAITVSDAKIESQFSKNRSIYRLIPNSMERSQP